jgi:signal transduction histidine kinase/ActR/RegA family two-component response regulator/long-subunit fatty acid transport protein
VADSPERKRDLADRWLIPVLWVALATAGPLLLFALDDHRLSLPQATFLWLLGAVLSAIALLWQGRRRCRTERSLEESRRYLLRAQRLDSVGRLAGGIAHDINNYLATIRAHCQLAAAKPLPHAEVERKMKVVEATVLKASSLVERLLTFGRRQPTRPEVVDLNEIVEGFETMVRPSLDSGPSLEVDLAADLWPVQADVAQLEQLLANLFVNAKDATPESGRLRLVTANVPATTTRPLEAPAGDLVCLAVSDSGHGIPVEVLERIFDPYFTTKEGTGGSGLGLAVVHGIVEAAGGAITVETQSGRGTTFRAFLPRHLPANAPRRRRGQQRRAARGHGETILLVDDNTDLAAAIRSQLEQLGYRLLTARGPEEAISWVEASSGAIDLVLTDVQLAGSSGPELVERIRQRYPVRVLYMSGYTERIALRSGPGKGEAYFLKKPFSADGLARMVRELLDQPPPPAEAPRSTATAVPEIVAALLLAGATALAAQPAPSLDTFGLLVALESRPSFAILGSGARAAGMGGAFTALADDASAVSFNPAGLALLVQPEASVVFDRAERRESHAGFGAIEDGVPVDFSPSQTAFDTTGLSFAAFTYPLTVAGNNLSLQLSFHRLIDFTEASHRSLLESQAGGPTTAELRQTVNQSGDLETLSIAAAYQWTQRLSVGVTLSRWSGDWAFSTVTEERDLGGDTSSSLSYMQENRWRGWNASLGALLRYRYLNVGATRRAPFDGDYDVASRLTTNFETPFADSSEADATLRWPGSWAVGIAFKPLQTWVVTLDYTEFDWDDMVISDLETASAEPLNFFDLRPESTSRVDNTGQWRTGTEYTWIRGRQVLGFRAGAFDLPRPQVGGPGDEKSSLRGISLGIGWKRGPLAFDVAYQRGTFRQEVLEFVDPRILVTGELATQSVGEVRVSEERLFFSLLYRFETRAKLRELGHFLFVGPKVKARREPPGEADPDS